MRGRMEYINSTLKSKLPLPADFELQIKVGIHSGEAVVGQLGSASKSEFTVMGEVVNIGARLASLSSSLDAAIIVSETVSKATAANHLYRPLESQWRRCSQAGQTRTARARYLPAGSRHYPRVQQYMRHRVPVVAHTLR